MNVERVGDWIQTYTGKKFWPLDPRVEEVDIIDIAHALSNTCRFGGHVDRFYSVAEHCWFISYLCGEHALWGLLHDASEAYIMDVPRPLKRFLTNYKDIEDNIMKVVCQKYNLSEEMPDIVKEMDSRIVLDEKYKLLKNTVKWENTSKPLGIPGLIQAYSPEEAKIRFISRFEELTLAN
jgi:uncharacterized protein